MAASSIMAIVEGANNKQPMPPKFISDDDMAKLSPPPPKFISDDDFAKMSQQPISRGEAAVTTLADSTTGGMLPTIHGLEEGYEAAKNSKSLSEALPNAKAAFSEARSGAQQDVASANEQYPYQSTALNIAGSVPVAAALPGGTALRAAGAGLLSGTGQAIGHANSPMEAAQDIGTGGLIGGSAGGLGAVAKGLGAAGQDLANTSDKYALSGAGFMLKDFRNASDKGKVGDLANTIRQEGLLKAGDTVSDVAEKSQVALDDSSQKLNSIWNQLKAASASPEAKNLDLQKQLDLHGFDPVLHKDEVLSTLQAQMKGQPGGPEAINKVGNYMDQLSKEYPDKISADDIRSIRQNVDQTINWSKRNNELPANQQAFKGLASYIRNKIDDQAEAAAAVGKPDLAKSLKSENARMSNLITINDAASDKVSRGDANRFLSLTDSIAGAGAMGGMMAHSPEHLLTNAVVGGGAALANKGARTYGPGLMSTATNALSGPANAVAPSLNTLGTGIQSSVPVVNQVVNQLAHRPDVKNYQLLGHGK